MFELYIIVSLVLFAYLTLAGIAARYAALIAMSWPLVVFFWIGRVIVRLISILVSITIWYTLGKRNH